jgi:hypothetical protein
MRDMFVIACALCVAFQGTSLAQNKDAKTVRVIVFAPQLPGTNEGSVAKAIKNGTFTAVEVIDAKSTPVKVSDIKSGKKEKPMQEAYHRQKISVTTKGEQYTNVDVFFAMSMTKGFKLNNFVERGSFTGKMETLMSHHYIIYEATIIRP